MDQPTPWQQQRLLRTLGHGLTERDLVGLLFVGTRGWPPDLADALEDFVRDILAGKLEPKA